MQLNFSYFNHFQGYISVVWITFTMLCCHRHPLPQFFHYPKQNSVLTKHDASLLNFFIFPYIWWYFEELKELYGHILLNPNRSLRRCGTGWDQNWPWLGSNSQKTSLNSCSYQLAFWLLTIIIRTSELILIIQYIKIFLIPRENCAFKYLLLFFDDWYWTMDRSCIDLKQTSWTLYIYNIYLYHKIINNKVLIKMIKTN